MVIHNFLAPVRDGSHIALVETEGNFPSGVAFNKHEQLEHDWVVLGLGPSVWSRIRSSHSKHISVTYATEIVLFALVFVVSAVGLFSLFAFCAAFLTLLALSALATMSCALSRGGRQGRSCWTSSLQFYP